MVYMRFISTVKTQNKKIITDLITITGEKPGNFDIVIVNDNFSKAYEKLTKFIDTEIQQKSDAGTVYDRKIRLHAMYMVSNH